MIPSKLIDDINVAWKWKTKLPAAGVIEIFVRPEDERKLTNTTNTKEGSHNTEVTKEK